MAMRPRRKTGDKGGRVRERRGPLDAQEYAELTFAIRHGMADGRRTLTAFVYADPLTKARRFDAYPVPGSHRLDFALMPSPEQAGAAIRALLRGNGITASAAARRRVDQVRRYIEDGASRGDRDVRLWITRKGGASVSVLPEVAQPDGEGWGLQAFSVEDLALEADALAAKIDIGFRNTLAQGNAANWRVHAPGDARITVRMIPEGEE